MQPNSKIRLAFSSLNISFKTIEDLGFNDDVFFEKMQNSFKRFSIVQDLKYFGVAGKKRKLFLDTKKLRNELKQGKLKSLIFSNKPSDTESTISLEIDINEDELDIRFINSVTEDNLMKEILTLREAAICFFQLFDGRMSFDVVSCISLLDAGYPQLRPPKIWRKFNPTALIDIINPGKVDYDDIKLLVKSLSESNLPNSAKRTPLRRNLILIDWFEILSPDEEFESIIAHRAKWIYEHSNFMVGTDYNNLGDKLITIIGKTKTKYFTFYSDFDKRAFKAMVPDINTGKLVDEDLINLKSWFEKGITPDGKEISGIYLILPSRNDAIRCKETADKYNFSGVLYVDNDGKLWNPFPKGIWLN